MAEGFRLDKRISITIVVLVLVQTFSALIWAGAAGERIAHAEEEAGRVQELSERAARLEVQAGAMREALTRIEAKMDRLSR
jgi:outer membrane murein-binding lipoprotein Lpp